MRFKILKAECAYCNQEYRAKEDREEVEAIKLPNGLYACIDHFLKIQSSSAGTN